MRSDMATRHASSEGPGPRRSNWEWLAAAASPARFGVVNDSPMLPNGHTFRLLGPETGAAECC